MGWPLRFGHDGSDQENCAALVTALVEDPRKSFKCVRLRAESAGAARLYERLGFVRIENPDATHILEFESR